MASFLLWCRGAESNRRHKALQASALPLSYLGLLEHHAYFLFRCLEVPIDLPSSTGHDTLPVMFETQLLTLIDQFGLYGIFLSIFLQEILVPLFIPNEALIFLAGYQSRLGNLNAAAIFSVAFLADQLASTLLYLLVRRFGITVIHKIGKFFHVNFDRLFTWEKHIKGSIVWLTLGRLIPLYRIYAVIIAGLNHVEKKIFFPINFMTSIIWAGTFLWLGVTLGHEHERILTWYREHEIWGAMGLVLIIVITTTMFFVRRRSRKKKALLWDKDNRNNPTMSA